MRDAHTGHAAELNTRLPRHLSCRPASEVDRSWQIRRLLVILVAIGICVTSPLLVASTISVIAIAFFAAVFAFRLFCVLIGFILRFWKPRREPSSNGADTMPIYSILIPLYREAAMVGDVVDAVSKLNWPSDRLDVQLLIESDDRETQHAANQISKDLPVRVTLVTGAGPRTKPNALNIGLAHARGSLICVYDAEDRPHPQQLRVAYDCFERGPQMLAALQAPLIGGSLEGGWISDQWCLDYSVHFGLLLPAYARLGVPIALGGSSNHFRTDILRSAGGWDAWNVTEDADLGLRLARLGLIVDTIWPPTFEDAPRTYPVWLAQRVRWLKGFLITWMVLMRPPRRLVSEMGVWRYLTTWITFGAAAFSPFIYAPATLLVTVALLTERYELGQAGLAVLAAGLATSLIADFLAPGRWSGRRVFAAFSRWLYWPLISVAAIGALIGMVRRPNYWAKTPHHPKSET